MQYYKGFSDQYNKVFEELIVNFINSIDSNTELYDFVTFYPQFGTPIETKPDFLVYGQAVNSWRTYLGDVQKMGVDSFVEMANKDSNEYLDSENLNPIDWVNALWSKSTSEDLNQNIYDYFKEEITREKPYWVYRSFFWQLVYKLICDKKEFPEGRGTWNWSKHLVYSNLFKIAPDEANPNYFYRNIQLEKSLELFKLELDEIKPKYCILLTNISWAKDFIDYIKPIEIPFNGISQPNIHFFGIYNQSKIIVTERPFRGNSDYFVQQILGLLND